MSGLCPHPLRILLLHVLEEEGRPAVIQRRENAEQHRAKVIGKAVNARRAVAQHFIHHHEVAVPQKQVGQAVEHYGNCQSQTEVPVLPVVEHPSRPKHIDAHDDTQRAIGHGQSQNSAHIPQLLRHQQNEAHGKGQIDQHHTQRQQKISARLEFVSKFIVQEVDAEGAKGVPQHEHHKVPLHFQRRGHGAEEQQHQCRAAKEGQQGQGHHRGLIAVLPLRRVLHPGIDQCAAGLQRGGDGHNSHPYIIGRQHTVAVGSQKPGKHKGGHKRQAPEQQGAEHIQESNSILFFHNSPDCLSQTRFRHSLHSLRMGV